jgi:hypothetical protein
MKPSRALQSKIDALFEQQTITEEDYKSLNWKEKLLFDEKRNSFMGELKGEQLSAFLDKIECTMPLDFNEEMWELNHDKICDYINETLQRCRRMPSKSEIAKKTGLARTTVYKHLNSFTKGELYKERDERFKLMRQTIMTALYTKCIHGDVNAMRFYFEVMGLTNKNTGNNIIATQHNYIQINNLKLSQEEIQKLSPEQLKQIEAIIQKT